MKQIERFDLIDKIGRELQSRMTYRDIDVYLGGFGVDDSALNPNVSYNSKWVYTKELLANADNSLVIRIADELEIPHPHVLAPGTGVVEARFWDPGHFRLFICHLASFKGKASILRDALRTFGISSFVAHVDVEPTREWQVEIENALFSMDGLLAILMPGFKESNWTDQEVGVAVGRGVPVIPVMRGLTPYGFIAKFQGFDTKGKTIGEVARSIFDILVSNERSRGKMWTAFIDTLVLANTLDQANAKVDVLVTLSRIPSDHLERLRDGAAQSRLFREKQRLRDRVNKVLKANGVSTIQEPEPEWLRVDGDLPF